MRVRTDQSSYGVRTVSQIPLRDTWLAAPEGRPPSVTLTTQSGLTAHSRLAAGRLPRAAPGSVTAATRQVEGAVTEATAKALGIKAGSVVHVVSGVRAGSGLAVRITGIVRPERPSLAYWASEPDLTSPEYFRDGIIDPRYWHAALMLPPEAGPVIPGVSPKTEEFWRLAPDTSGLTSAGLPALRSAVASAEHGPGLTALTGAVSPVLTVDSRLDTVLLDVDSLFASVTPVVSVGAFGVGTVAAVVLLMAGGLAAARRRDELALLRARGASVRGVAGRLLAESAVSAVPAAAIGCALAVVLVPGQALTPSLLGAAATAALACAVLPVRAAVPHRVPRLHEARADLARARPSRRRTVAELTALVLAVGAVVALRRRGADAAGGVDQLVSLAPVLVGLIAALVLGRLYPLPLRLAALPAARRRGATGFLSLARAGRAPAAAALPLLALLIALTTAAFGGSVLTGVTHARDDAALRAVGADAAVSAVETLPKGLARSVRAVRGVTDVAPVEQHEDLQVLDTGTDATDGQSVTLLAVDPASYARLARRTGRGAFDADTLVKKSGSAGGDGSSALPAIASPGAAKRLGSAVTEVDEPGLSLQVEVAAVRTATPALFGGDFLVVDAAYLPRHADTGLLVTGASLDARQLRATVRAAGPDLEVRVRTEARASLADSPVQTGTQRVYLVAVAAGAGYAALALLLSVVQAAPERVALLARLRTLGMTRRQGRRLLILEALPQALLAALGGALVGWAAIRLLAPGLDLTPLALSDAAGAGPVRLRADPWSLLLPAVAVVVLAAGVATVQAWLSTRRGATTELRAGGPR
ncbi:FtsX-like permease family protein [Streptomyces sp. 8L]|uniref:FtsX-like permease family protein n=1 Tax=Streptomyces sp. 8L TaxID=2877242 RepID=UPI001CD46F39|nr:FtsX-like permease family protein [Streptomyces sp. 8L]MCA1223231.1 ABC transporter permease [Streptomyces sp. 8L]